MDVLNYRTDELRKCKMTNSFFRDSTELFDVPSAILNPVIKIHRNISCAFRGFAFGEMKGRNGEYTGVYYNFIDNSPK